MKLTYSAIHGFYWVLVSRGVCIIQIVTVCQLRTFNQYQVCTLTIKNVLFSTYNFFRQFLNQRDLKTPLSEQDSFRIYEINLFFKNKFFLNLCSNILCSYYVIKMHSIDCYSFKKQINP